MSTKILAIETSTTACSVALMVGEQIIERYELAGRRQAQLILPMVKSLLSEKGLQLSAVDALAFGQGPGSFTGLRIAASVTQGLAFGANLPVIPISSMQAFAQGIAEQSNASNVLVALDAKMAEIYWAAYRIDKDNLMQAVVKDCLIAPDQITVPDGEEWIGVGDGWEVYQEILAKQLGKKIKETLSDQYPHARDVAKLALEQYRLGNMVSAEEALPVYLRGKAAWRK